MNKKTRTDAAEFKALQEIGLELEAPQDEYSYQPDSGGTANGYIAKIEYGIDVNLDALGRETADSGESSIVEDSSLPIPGESEWSQRNRLPEDEIGERIASEDDSDLITIIRDRLFHHPILKDIPISVAVRDGVVMLEGEVQNVATKVLFREVVGEFAEPSSIANELTIPSI